MRTIAFTTFIADIEDRARRSDFVDFPVDSLRNKGGRRTENKRMLLARAAARSDGKPHPVISYF